MSYEPRSNFHCKLDRRSPIFFLKLPQLDRSEVDEQVMDIETLDQFTHRLS